MTDGAPDKPHGRDEVVTAVLASATQLFAEHGFRRVSIRAIGEHADVNPGLIHRHFGTKSELIQAVLDHATRASSRRIMSAIQSGGFEEVIAAMESEPFVALIARGIAEQRYTELLERDFPMMRFAKSALEGAPDAQPAADAEACIAFGSAALMGWVLFRAFLLRGAAMEGWSDERIHREFAKIIRAIVGTQPT